MIRRLIVWVREHPHPVALWGVVAVSVAVLAGFSWAINGNRTNARLGKQSHDALCILKHDLEQRAIDSATFLAKHPDGFAGIDAATIQNSIKNQLATVDSLSLLDCVPPPKETP